MLLVVAGVVVAGLLAFYAATTDQAARPAPGPAAPEVARGEGFEQYGQVEYVPVAQDNARTLTLLFGGIGAVSALVVVAAVVSVRRERASD